MLEINASLLGVGGFTRGEGSYDDASNALVQPAEQGGIRFPCCDIDVEFRILG